MHGATQIEWMNALLNVITIAGLVAIAWLKSKDKK